MVTTPHLTVTMITIIIMVATEFGFQVIGTGGGLPAVGGGFGFLATGGGDKYPVDLRHL
jgi:hypothetical protein